jgi:endonuclease/exonuclease/phosphatase family metal-dependent hydrolase
MNGRCYRWCDCHTLDDGSGSWLQGPMLRRHWECADAHRKKMLRLKLVGAHALGFVVAIIIGLIAGTLGGCSQPPAETLRLDLAPGPGVLRVVGLNVAGGYSAAYRTAAANTQQRAFLQALQPDVVCYQEAWGPTAQWQTQYAPGPGWWRGDALETVDGQPSGVAVWVRQGLSVGDSWVVPVDWEKHPRDALMVKVANVLVSCAHLDTGSSANRRREVDQIYAATAVVGTNGQPLTPAEPELVVGDMNDSDGQATTQARQYAEPLTPIGDDMQAWSRTGGAGGLAVTHGTSALVSDHPYGVVAEIPSP